MLSIVEFFNITALIYVLCRARKYHKMYSRFDVDERYPCLPFTMTTTTTTTTDIIVVSFTLPSRFSFSFCFNCSHVAQFSDFSPCFLSCRALPFVFYSLLNTSCNRWMYHVAAIRFRINQCRLWRKTALTSC